MEKKNDTIDMEIGNCLIAEFMGNTPIIDVYHFYMIDGVGYREDNLKYDTSWDWLMPSWGKLSSLLLAKGAFELIEEFKNAVVKNDIIEAWNIIVKGIQVINE